MSCLSKQEGIFVYLSIYVYITVDCGATALTKENVWQLSPLPVFIHSLIQHLLLLLHHLLPCIARDGGDQSMEPEHLCPWSNKNLPKSQCESNGVKAMYPVKLQV